MKRLWLYVGIGSGLAIAVIVLLYYFTQPIFIAAFLGAWPAFIIALYDRFVNVPLISFDKKSIRKDSLQVIDRGGVVWNFLKLPINNSGFAPARNCRAEIRVLSRPRQNDQNCPAPYDEPKGLKWSGSNPRESYTIPSRRGSAIIDLLIDDTSITPVNRSSWHGASNWGPLTLWAGTHEVFAMSPLSRAQDAFCQGNYEIEVTIFPENGAPKSAKFKLYVDALWGKTSLT
jgi:hypothetical protein